MKVLTVSKGLFKDTVTLHAEQPEKVIMTTGFVKTTYYTHTGDYITAKLPKHLKINVGEEIPIDKIVRHTKSPFDLITSNYVRLCR